MRENSKEAVCGEAPVCEADWYVRKTTNSSEFLEGKV